MNRPHATNAPECKGKMGDKAALITIIAAG